MRKILAVVFVGLVLAACSSVDSTERCIKTRYGKVVEQEMADGLNFTMFHDVTCFTMTERNYPEGTVTAADGKEYQRGELIEAQTRDPITIAGDVAIVYRYDPATIYETFLDKRTPEATEAEIVNAIREGYRNALARWSISEVFANRPQLADSVKAHIQRKLTYVNAKGEPYYRASIVNVFVRDIKVPQQIEEARIAAARQAQVLDQARQQYVIDSVNARKTVMTAEASARAKTLEAASYAANPKLLELETAKAMAMGIANACRQAQTCVIGGSVMDTWKAGIR